MENIVRSKTCDKCKKTQDITNFAEYKLAADGYYRFCKNCHNSPPKVLTFICPVCGQTKAKTSRSPAVICGDCIASRAQAVLAEERKAWAIANPWYRDEKRAQIEAYRASRKELRDIIKQMYQSQGLHKDRIPNNKKTIKLIHDRIGRYNRYLALISAPTNFTYLLWLEKVAYYGWRCVYCAKPLSFNTLTCDHFKPLRLGGTHYISNLVPACRSCNSKKHTSLWQIGHRPRCAQSMT